MNQRIKQRLTRAGYYLPIAAPAVTLIMALVALYLYYEPLFKYETEIGIALIITVPTILALIMIYFGILARMASMRRSLKKKAKVAIITYCALCTAGSVFFGFLYQPFIDRHGSFGPALTWGTSQDPSTSITIMWQSRSPSGSLVRYGINRTNLNLTAENQTITSWHKLAIDGLTPGTTYYYHVDGLDSNPGIHQFVTAPPVAPGGIPGAAPPTSFTFLAFSDPAQNTGELAIALQPNGPARRVKDRQSAGIRPAFTIMTGDITNTATNNITWKSWFDQTSDSGLGSEAAIAIAVGNHERHENCAGDLFAARYPIENRPGFYYSFNYSQLHVQVLDPWNYTTCDFGALSPEQLAWAESDLANASAMPFKIICMHPPPARNGQFYPSMTSIASLCAAHDVDAVLFGHHHDYEVSQINGTWFFLIGVGGNLNGQWLGYCQVDVTPETMNVTMRWLNGARNMLCTIKV